MKQLFLGACLVALASSPVMAQSGGADMVVVRVAERYSQTHLTIERAGQEPEEIAFEWDSRIDKKFGRASKGYLEALGKLYQQGYQVQATIPGAANGNSITYTTLIFTKGK